MAIELAEFGRTGHDCTRVIVGGACLWAFAGPQDEGAVSGLMDRSAAEPLFV